MDMANEKYESLWCIKKLRELESQFIGNKTEILSSQALVNKDNKLVRVSYQEKLKAILDLLPQLHPGSISSRPAYEWAIRSLGGCCRYKTLPCLSDAIEIPPTVLHCIAWLCLARCADTRVWGLAEHHAFVNAVKIALDTSHYFKRKQGDAEMEVGKERKKGKKADKKTGNDAQQQSTPKKISDSEHAQGKGKTQKKEQHANQEPAVDQKRLTNASDALEINEETQLQIAAYFSDIVRLVCLSLSSLCALSPPTQPLLKLQDVTEIAAAVANALCDERVLLKESCVRFLLMLFPVVVVQSECLGSKQKAFDTFFGALLSPLSNALYALQHEAEKEQNNSENDQKALKKCRLDIVSVLPEFGIDDCREKTQTALYDEYRAGFVQLLTYFLEPQEDYQSKKRQKTENVPKPLSLIQPNSAEKENKFLSNIIEWVKSVPSLGPAAALISVLASITKSPLILQQLAVILASHDNENDFPYSLITKHPCSSFSSLSPSLVALIAPSLSSVYANLTTLLGVRARPSLPQLDGISSTMLTKLMEIIKTDNAVLLSNASVLLSAIDDYQPLGENRNDVLEALWRDNSPTLAFLASSLLSHASQRRQLRQFFCDMLSCISSNSCEENAFFTAQFANTLETILLPLSPLQLPDVLSPFSCSGFTKCIANTNKKGGKLYLALWSLVVDRVAVSDPAAEYLVKVVETSATEAHDCWNDFITCGGADTLCSFAKLGCAVDPWTTNGVDWTPFLKILEVKNVDALDAVFSISRGMRILSPEVRESLRYLFLTGMKSSSEKTVSIILNDWKHFCGIADKEAIELFIDEALCSDWGQEIAETDEFTESLIIRRTLPRRASLALAKWTGHEDVAMKLIGNPTEGIEVLKQISEKDELYPINSSVDKIIPTLKIASKFLKKDVYYYRKKGFIVKTDKHESLRSLTILFTAVMLWTRKTSVHDALLPLFEMFISAHTAFIPNEIAVKCGVDSKYLILPFAVTTKRTLFPSQSRRLTPPLLIEALRIPQKVKRVFSSQLIGKSEFVVSGGMGVDDTKNPNIAMLAYLTKLGYYTPSSSFADSCDEECIKAMETVTIINDDKSFVELYYLILSGLLSKMLYRPIAASLLVAWRKFGPSKELENAFSALVDVDPLSAFKELVSSDIISIYDLQAASILFERVGESKVSSISPSLYNDYLKRILEIVIKNDCSVDFFVSGWEYIAEVVANRQTALYLQTVSAILSAIVVAFSRTFSMNCHAFYETLCGILVSLFHHKKPVDALFSHTSAFGVALRSAELSWRSQRSQSKMTGKNVFNVDGINTKSKDESGTDVDDENEVGKSRTENIDAKSGVSDVVCSEKSAIGVSSCNKTDDTLFIAHHRASLAEVIATLASPQNKAWNYTIASYVVSDCLKLFGRQCFIQAGNEERKELREATAALLASLSEKMARHIFICADEVGREHLKALTEIARQKKELARK